MKSHKHWPSSLCFVDDVTCCEGLLLKPFELEVVLLNDMDLRAFPFDSDDVLLTFLQDESSSAKEFVFVPWTSDSEGDDVSTSVKCFYDVKETPEFEVPGFSLDMYTGIGGNGVEYAHCGLRIHIRRRPYYYIRNIIVPIVLTTTLAFTAFFYDIEELEARYVNLLYEKLLHYNGQLC